MTLITNIRKGVVEGFRRLQTMGVIARRNFRCCSTCASYELGQALEQKKGKWGYVYWHHQN